MRNFLWFLLAVPFCLWSQEAPVDSENGAVVISEEHYFEVLSLSKAKYRRIETIKIFNEKGNEYAQVFEGADKFTKIRKISAMVNDSNGKIITKFNPGSRDIKLNHYNQDHILFSEEMYFAHDLSSLQFPYVIRLEVEKELSSLLFWPNWVPQRDIPVESSTYQLILPREMLFKQKPVNVSVEPVVVDQGSKRQYTWALQQIPALKEVLYMPPLKEHKMAIYFSPIEFALEEYHGSAESWSAFSKWICALNENVLTLDESTLSQILSMCQSLETPEEKIAALYSFLQSHTRYVAAYKGIATLQPMKAQQVYSSGYGDCKGLTMLMIAMLKSVGIEAYPAYVRTRDLGPIFVDFPSNQFNHVFAMVPIANDTLYLECTSKYLTVHDIANSCRGCDILVIFPDGGRLLKMPRALASENSTITKFRGDLHKIGNLSFKAEIHYQGHEKNSTREAFINARDKEITDGFAKYLSSFQPKLLLAGHSVENLDDNRQAPLVLHAEGTIEKCAQISSGRLFVNPNMVNRWTADQLPREKSRCLPIDLYNVYTHIDSIFLGLPADCVMESAPDSMNLKYSFAEFQANYKIENNQLVYFRRLKIENPMIPPEQYAEFVEFTQKVIKQDGSLFVFRRAKP